MTSPDRGWYIAELLRILTEADDEAVARIWRFAEALTAK